MPKIGEAWNMVTTPLSDAELAARVNEVIAPYGCAVTGFGPEAVGVMGDARRVGTSVLISVPPGTSPEVVREISTEIINKVRGIARVLMDI